MAFLDGQPIPAHHFVCAVLRGDALRFPVAADDAYERELVAICEVHGVQALLQAAADAGGAVDSWPPGLRKRLGDAALSAAARELLVKRELVALLQRFSDAGIDSLLIKGAPLAYTLYPQPYLRTRGDTDVLVPEAQRQLAHETLLCAGYGAATSYARELASYQLSYRRGDRAGAEHLVDLHWRLSNSTEFSRVFSFEDLRDPSVSVPALSPNARTPAPAHALIIACMHRATHIASPYYVNGTRYLEANRLIWLYDMHLLVERLSESEWSEFLALASAKRLRAVCLDALRAAKACFRTSIPGDALARLEAEGPSEPSARYLRPGQLQRYMVQLRSLPNWSQRAGLVGEWAFPPAEHMFRKYGVRSRWRLPFLYLRRGVGGVAKMFRYRAR